MPTTVNGIGTHYYGKKNQTTRTGPCKSCGRVGNLESYDTRLWFVIVLIPLIPLGRKRVIDSCPSCRRHFVADADAYEQARQLQVSAARTSSAAIRRLPRLCRCTRRCSAFTSRTGGEVPPDGPRAVPGRRRVARRPGRGSSSTSHRTRRRASSTRPPTGSSRNCPRPASRWHGGRWSRASSTRRGSSSISSRSRGPASTMRLGPLDVMSTYYQKQGRHEEALAIAAHLLREIPEAGQQHKFRSFVARSEKALGVLEASSRPDSIPCGGYSGAMGTSTRGACWAAIGGTALLLLAAGLGVNNEYIRRHRTIHFVNACGARSRSASTTSRPSPWETGPPRRAGGQAPHPAQRPRRGDARGGTVRRLPRPLVQQAGLGAGPGGEAVLIAQTLYYAQNPMPAQHRLIVGQPFVAIPHVNYLFGTAAKQPPGQAPGTRGSSRSLSSGSRVRTSRRSWPR